MWQTNRACVSSCRLCFLIFKSYSSSFEMPSVDVLPSAVSLISMKRGSGTPAAVRWKWPPPALASYFDCISIIQMPQMSVPSLSALDADQCHSQHRSIFLEAKREKYFQGHWFLFALIFFTVPRLEEGAATKCNILTACFCQMFVHRHTTQCETVCLNAASNPVNGVGLFRVTSFALHTWGKYTKGEL